MKTFRLYEGNTVTAHLSQHFGKADPIVSITQLLSREENPGWLDPKVLLFVPLPWKTKFLVGVEVREASAPEPEPPWTLWSWAVDTDVLNLLLAVERTSF